MAASDRFDGRRLKALTGDPTKFKQYIDTKFEKLDVSKSGSLSAEDLKPAVAEWGSLLGLPPMGSSSETDQMYSEITSQYLDASKKSGKVDRSTFEVVTRDILLGISDSLEANPISVDTIDGSQLRHLLAPEQRAEFQLLADRAYEAINTGLTEERNAGVAQGTKSEGDAPAASEKAMDGRLGLSATEAVGLALKKHLTIEEGVPPASSQKVEALIDRAVSTVVSQGGQQLTKEDFTEQLRAALAKLAEGLQASPLTVAHTETDVKGEKIKPLMEDQEAFSRVVHQVFEEYSVDGKMPRSEFWTAFDRVGAQAGLPPLGASDKMDNVYDTIIGDREAAPGAFTEPELRTHLQEALFLVGAKLTADPVILKVAQVVGDENDATSATAQKEQQVGVPGRNGVPVGGAPRSATEQDVGVLSQNEAPVGGAPGVGGQLGQQEIPRGEVPTTAVQQGVPRMQSA